MGLFKDCGCGCNGKKQQKKFIISVVSGLLFFIISNPETFKIVRKMLGNWVANQYGTATTYGLLLHAFIFMMIVWAMMNISRENDDGMPAPSKDKEVTGPPPQPVPETPVPNTTELPPVQTISQPVADIPAIPTSPKPSAPVSDSSMSNINRMLGGYDISTQHSNGPPSTGTNWKQCAFDDGTRVMVLGS